MGLSVISKIASTLNTATSAAPTDATSGLPGDFAALLSGQNFAALLESGNSTATQAGRLVTQKDRTKEDSGTNPLAELSVTPAIDPVALVALIGPPQIQPPVTPRAPLGQEVQQSTAASEAGSGLSDTLLGTVQESQSRCDQSFAFLPQATEDVPMFEAPSAARKSDFADSLPGDTKQSNSSRGQSASSPLQAAANTPTTPSAAEKSGLADTANIAAPTENIGATPNFVASLATAVHHQTTAHHAQANVIPPLHSEAWPQQFGEKIVWMAKNDQQSAQINLNPPQLGPLQITLNLSGDQATAVFASPHAEVRQAIESSLPQLREMLSSAGIALGDANVGANMAQQNPNNAFQTPNRALSSLENAILPANDNAPVAGIAAPLHQGRGLVDLFA